jgi:hypothetical protein
VKVLIEAVAPIEAVREAVLVLVKAVRVLLCEWAKSVQHCKKRLSFFLSPAGMSLTKLSLAGNY